MMLWKVIIIASESTSKLIWLAISMVIALSLAGAFVTISGRIVDSIEDDTGQRVGDKEARISVVNTDGTLYEEDDGNYTIFIKNVGSRNLLIDEMIIGVGGELHSSDDINATIVDGDEWAPSKICRAEFNSSIDYGEYDVWVSVPALSGDRVREGTAECEFKIRVSNDD